VRKIIPKKITPRALKLIGVFLILAGLSVLLYVPLTDLYARYQQRRLARGWEQEAVEKESTEPEFTDEETVSPATEQATLTEEPEVDQAYYRDLKEGEVFGRLVIPRIELDTIVLEGTSREVLRKAPGHIVGTGLPSSGNCAISGHRVTFGAWFNRLDELEVGDLIILYSPNREFKYAVMEKRIVVPTDVSVIQPTSDIRLTLTACHPPHSARRRLIVIAKLLSPTRHKPD
jgi:sortase A